MNKHCAIKERGGIAATLLMFIPATSLLIAVLLDISGWFLMREECQLRVDIAALVAAQQLPDQSAVRRVFTQLLADQTDVGIETTATGIRVTVAWQYVPPVSSRLLRIPRPFRIGLNSEVEVVPRDYILVVADGAQLRPSWYQRADGVYALEQPWGAEQPDDAAHILHCLAAPQLPHTPIPWSTAWSDREVRRWLLQACRNPVLSSLKEAALAAVIEASAFDINRIALIFTPGSAPQGATLVRPLLGVSAQFVSDGPPQGTWIPSLSSDLTVSDEICALFTANEPHQTEGCPLFDTPPRCGDAYRAFGIVSECHRARHFTIAEAISWHAIRNDTDRDVTPNLLAALAFAERELATAPSTTKLSELRARRPTYWHTPAPVVLVLSDTLPAPGLLRAQLAKLIQRGASILLIAFVHQGLSPSAAKLLQEHAAALAEGPQGSLDVHFAPSPEVLPQIVGARLAEIGRRYALKR